MTSCIVELQQKPADHEEKVRNFHLEIRRVATSVDAAKQLGQFSLSTIANVDLTSLPLTFNKGQGCDQKGAKPVWHCGTQSRLDKRQCTVQLTIFTDGEPRVKPLLIFRGKGLRISQTERKKYDILQILPHPCIPLVRFTCSSQVLEKCLVR